jgi:alkanesulfonate monooxygenase SsuD/methylene tetrahydromethanopterin reductase-like flavin-dependent oxidoreductase (luciferase family)
LFYLPSVGSRADIEACMAGLRGDLYGRMLQEVSEQARLADDLGYDSINFTEHHFHVEGIELSNNPVMLDLYIGMQTKRLRVGQLGIVLPADNPIRIAEDIAMLDHMTGGRANAGFARGYQRRWVDVMAQHTHGVHGAVPNKHDDIDEEADHLWQNSSRFMGSDLTSYICHGFRNTGKTPMRSYGVHASPTHNPSRWIGCEMAAQLSSDA